MKRFVFAVTVVSILLAILDQLTKFFVIKYFLKPKILIDGFLKIIYSENTGIAFSIPFPFTLLMILTVFLIGLILYFSYKELDLNKKLSIFSVSLVIGGALGNLADRLAKGYVVDFLSIWKYPLFNLADVFIVAGILMLGLFYGRIKRNKN